MTVHLKILAIGAALALAATCASADTLHFGAVLKGADETPPNDSAGTGKVTATLDTGTNLLKYKIAYSGLTGPATAAHFHGPAAPGADGPPVVPVPTNALASPMRGSATLTVEQIGQLESGKWYFNIHTAAHPGGEVRGQVEEQQ
jgi:hypothetical protein